MVKLGSLGHWDADVLFPKHGFIGTTAALIAAGIASAGASVASSAIQAHAAHDAANTQVAAGDKAAGVLGQIYAGQQAALAPYQQAGQQALGPLSSMLNKPVPQFAPGQTANFANPPGWTPPPVPAVSTSPGGPRPMNAPTSFGQAMSPQALGQGLLPPAGSAWPNPLR